MNAVLTMPRTPARHVGVGATTTPRTPRIAFRFTDTPLAPPKAHLSSEESPTGVADHVADSLFGDRAIEGAAGSSEKARGTTEEGRASSPVKCEILDGGEDEVAPEPALAPAVILPSEETGALAQLVAAFQHKFGRAPTNDEVRDTHTRLPSQPPVVLTF